MFMHFCADHLPAAICLSMNSFEHMGHLAHLARWHMTEYVAVEMHHAALPARIGQIVGNALNQPTAGIRDDQLNASQAPIDKVTKERGPTGPVFLGSLTNAQNLPIAVFIDSACNQQGYIANLTSPFAIGLEPMALSMAHRFITMPSR